MRLRPRRRAAVATAAGAVAALLAGLLAGCATGPADEDELVVWTLENLTERVRVTERIAARFTERTGIPVRIVAIDENQFSQMVMSAAAADRLPDVVGALPLTATWQMAGNELLDTDATGELVRALGPGTFSARALRLTSDGGRQLAVPSDGWAQLLFYRKDLFDAAGLERPDTYERILRAARTLHRDGVAGISITTSAGDAGTGQAFEGLALGNGCQLTGQDGTVTLDSPRCRTAFRLVADLATRYSPPGSQDIDSTRATYFAGQSAMVVWSSFLLDELGALRDSAMPSCPQCADDPGFLARNTGVVSAIRGPDGAEPVQYGELTSWVVPVRAKRDQAKRFVEYMMGEDAYPRWLGMAPEGKIPVRRGTAAEPERFSAVWHSLPAGVDSKRPLAEIYPPDVLRDLADSPERVQRWGFEQGQGVLAGATLGEMPVGKAVDSLLGGSGPDEAAERAAEDVRAIQTSLR